MLDDGELFISRAPVFTHACATPLSSLLLHLEYASRLTHTRATHHYLTHAMTNARHLQQLFRDIQVSSDESVDHPKKSFPVKTTLTEAVYFARAACHHSTIISHFETIPTQLKMPGRPLLLQEALVCLITNGSEAYRVDDQAVVSVVAQYEASKLVLRVIDGGEGFPSHVPIESPYGFTLKDGHTGIGLSFVRRVVGDHFNSQFSHMDNQDGGSIMTLVLPVC